MSRPDPYAPHARFVRPAYARSEPMRVIAVLIGFEVIMGLTGLVTYELLPQDVENPDSSPFGTVFGFAVFGLALILFHFLVRQIHHRGIETMLGPWDQLWRDGRKTLIAVGLPLAVLAALTVLSRGDTIVQTRNLLAWATMLPFALFAIGTQCATEEVVFRGYLQQQVAAVTRGRLAYIVVPSLAFGIGHYWNGWGPADGILYAVWATTLGLACADLTARSGSIGAAVGLHLANNLYATIVLAERDGASSGLALFLSEPVDWASYNYDVETLLDLWVAYEVIFSSLVVLIMWLCARIALRR